MSPAIRRLHVADLRAAVARRGNDAAATGLVNRLRERSPEFAQMWGRHEVSVRRQSQMRVRHPRSASSSWTPRSC
jgi:hypothetical protein